jgi:hypothetical protein
MPPERAMLARNKTQIDELREKLAALEAKAEKYQKIIDAPGKSEQTLVDRLADLAKRFIESGPDSNGDDSTAAARAQMQLIVQQKAAESATTALKEVELEIEMQKFRIDGGSRNPVARSNCRKLLIKPTQPANQLRHHTRCVI